MAPTPIPSAVVTGGAGFVGAGIVRMLQSRHPECKITVFDLRIPVPTTIESERPDPRLIPGVTYERVDITDRPLVCELILKIKPTLVIHSAGVIPTVPLLLQKDPKKSDLFEQVNLEGTRNMLDASEAAGVNAFVYTSSADVVKGDSWVDQNGVNENMPYPKSWDNQYAKSKALAEQLVLARATGSFFTSAIRPHAVFGPHDPNIVAMWYLVLKTPLGTRMMIDPGTNLYDFTYVDNCALGHVLAAENLLSATENSAPSASGKAFFITDAEPVTFREMLLAVWRAYGHTPGWHVTVPIKLSYVMVWMGERLAPLTGSTPLLTIGMLGDSTSVRWYDCGRAAQLLGYKPVVERGEAIRRTCEVIP